MLKDSQKLTPGILAEMSPSSRLNIVFDIDHTLIFTIDKKLYPRLDLHPDFKYKKNVQDIVIQSGASAGYEFWLVVRFGVQEMLEYLSTFCDFYVYSHGFYEYVLAILDHIDPE